MRLTSLFPFFSAQKHAADLFLNLFFSNYVNSALKELNHTEESIQKILEVAKEKAVGNNQQDLDRIRAALKRLKFGTIELSTEQGFLKALLSGKEDEVMFGKQLSRRSRRRRSIKNCSEVKQLQEENKKREKETEETIARVHEEYGLYVKEKEELQKIIDEVAQLEDESKAAEMLELSEESRVANEQSSVGVAGREKTKKELQNELKELDNALKRMNRGIAQKEGELSKD